MKKLRLEIIGMSYSQSQTGAYALILGAPGDKRRLPIIIGGPEAQSIAMQLEKIVPTRPLTHDLFKRFAEHFQVKIIEVVINKFEEGIFYSLLVCEHMGHVVEIDSRTSDAVALALRFNCPVFVYESILDEAGIVMEDEPMGEDPEAHQIKIKKKKRGGKYDDLSDDQLAEMLKVAVEKENYEEASLIRDELEKRKE
ncbi:MAG: bifunctional nuclease family protein [Bacteroidetes bacterium]|nr:bifunctional nuclease family protein [Bacteroidota bacterium]